MPESTYSVYLIERRGEQGGKREVTSPVRGHALDFYDAGVWLDRETGRNFFPYEQVRTIREHPEGQAPEHATEPITESESDEGEDDSGTEAGPGAEAEPEPGADSATEGDPGAEEEMLE
jgi:hypothetical protein